MNGRLYDAKLHRFLQPDNFIQDPYNTQNYNRYGYVLNNPLKYNDPSGEEFSLLAAAVVGAIISATSYTLTALLADVPFTPGGFIKASFMGALSGAVSFGIGEVAQGFKVFANRFIFQALAHGTSQGFISGIQGGDFVQGFVSGALSSMASGLFIKYGGNFSQSTVGILSFGTISGGLGAVLTKGNFWQGAATGLVVSGLNHLAHMGFTKKSNGEKFVFFDPDDPNNSALIDQANSDVWMEDNTIKIYSHGSAISVNRMDANTLHNYLYKNSPLYASSIDSGKTITIKIFACQTGSINTPNVDSPIAAQMSNLNRNAIIIAPTTNLTIFGMRSPGAWLTFRQGNVFKDFTKNIYLKNTTIYNSDEKNYRHYVK